MSHFIYADHAATTAVSDTALQAMLPHFTAAYGNPSSLYRFAQEGKTVIFVNSPLLTAYLGLQSAST